MNRSSLWLLLETIRVKHWLKNLLLFALPLSAGFSSFNWIQTGLEFLILSLSSSTNYVINDLKDLGLDSKNESKKSRPLASKRVSIKYGLKAVLISFSMFIFLNALSPIWYLNILFFVTQFTYTFYFKKLPFFEILILSILYVFRGMIPYTYSNIPFSFWYFYGILFSSMLLVLTKRFSEYLSSGAETRPVLSNYNREFFLFWITSSNATLLILAILWIEDLWNQNGNIIVFAIFFPIVLLLMRISRDSMHLRKQNLVDFIFNDKSIIMYFIVFIVLYYFAKGFKI